MNIKEREELEVAITEMRAVGWIDDEEYWEKFDAIWSEDESENNWAKIAIKKKQEKMMEIIKEIQEANKRK